MTIENYEKFLEIVDEDLKKSLIIKKNIYVVQKVVLIAASVAISR